MLPFCSELPCYQGHDCNSLCLPIWKAALTKASVTETAGAAGLQDADLLQQKSPNLCLVQGEQN